MFWKQVTANFAVTLVNLGREIDGLDESLLLGSLLWQTSVPFRVTAKSSTGCAVALSPQRKLNLKVSVKGALSVYGLQRMPVTLYVEQWMRLLAIAEEIRQFAKEHDGQLKRKVAAVAA